MSVEIPKIEMPKVEFPKVELPNVDTTKVVDAARNLVYLTVGVGAAAAEKVETARKDAVAQATSTVEQRREQFDKALDEARNQIKASFVQGRTRLEDLRDQVQLSVAEAQDRYDAVVGQVDDVIESINEKLPEPVQKIAVQMHTAAKSARQQVRDRVAPAA